MNTPTALHSLLWLYITGFVVPHNICLCIVKHEAHITKAETKLKVVLKCKGILYLIFFDQ